MTIKQQFPFPWVVLLWLLLTLLASLQLAVRTSWETDLTAFLPQADSLQQQILMAELKRGNASRLWMIGLTTDSANKQAKLTQASQILAGILSNSDAFSSVHNSRQPHNSASRELLFRYRYLLQPQAEDFSVDHLKLALDERLAELSMPIAAFKEDLVGSDPTDSFLHLLSRLEAELPTAKLNERNGIWFSNDGKSALLFAQSVSNSMDAKAQAVAYQQLQLAVTQMRQQLVAGSSIKLELAGAPLIALKTSENTRAASIRLSVWASIFMIMLLLLAYRSPQAVLLAAIPPVLAVLFATAISSLIFPLMHVLTLAFGVTLLGVALDYPVHILSQQKSGESLRQSAQRIWPTLRIGVLTTIFAFAALIWTDFEGILRLGVFSIAGLSVAALASRYLLPALAELPGFRKRLNPTGLGWLQNLPDVHIRPVFFILTTSLLLVLAGFGLFKMVNWSDDIAALSPVSTQLIAQEQQLRSKLNLPEPGTQILLHADSVDELLAREQALLPFLYQARNDGLIEGWEMAATLLPSTAHQRQLQELLPDTDVLQAQLKLAQQGLPFVSTAFDEFINAVEQSKMLPPLTLEMFSNTQLASWLDSLIIDLSASESGATGFGGIVRFTGLSDAAALKLRLQAFALPQTWLLQTRNEISLSLQKFRLKLSQLLLISAVIISLILWLLLAQPTRVIHIVLAVAAAVLGSAWVSYIIAGSLNLLHLLALILVAGISIDYALFFTRSFNRGVVGKEEKAATLHALLVCMCSSTAVFFLLAVSGIKVLESIGMVVTAGVLLAFVFSLLAGFSMNSFGAEEKPNYNNKP